MTLNDIRPNPGDLYTFNRQVILIISNTDIGIKYKYIKVTKGYENLLGYKTTYPIRLNNEMLIANSTMLRILYDIE